VHKSGFEEWLVSAVMSMYTGAKAVLRTNKVTVNLISFPYSVWRDNGEFLVINVHFLCLNKH